MDNAARMRQRVLALILPIAAVLYIGGEALSPKGTDQLITTAATACKVLPIAAQHHTQLYLASALGAVGKPGGEQGRHDRRQHRHSRQQPDGAVGWQDQITGGRKAAHHHYQLR